MKFIYRAIALLLVFGVMACDNTELDLLDNPNAVPPANASVTDLYNNIQLDFDSFFQGAQDNPGSMTRMYAAIGSFVYEGTVSPTSLSGIWFSAYSEMFPDIDVLVEIAEEVGLNLEAGSAKVMKAYAMITLVDLFGDVPYSEIGQGVDVISPAADPGASVYAAAIALLDEAIAQLEAGGGGNVTDIFYDGDHAKWATLAKSLKLKAALATKDASTINALVTAGDLIDASSEDFQFQYGNTRNNPNSRHPNYNNHYEQGDGDYLSNYYMWLLRADKVDDAGTELRDPRLRYYFKRKVDDAIDQDQTTFSCHFSILPDQSAAPDHWDAVDPRLPYCVAAADGYSGRDHLNGEGIPPDGPIRTTYGLYPFGGQFDDDTFDADGDTRQAGTTGGLGQGISPILLSSYVDFMRAEAALSLGTSDNARELLERGMRTSIAKVMSFTDLVPTTMSRLVEVRGGEPKPVSELFVPTAEEVDTYVNFVLAEYDAADADGKLNVVVREYYIAAWGNGLEAYNMYRRTGKPDNMMPTLEPDGGNFPRSYPYPDVYVNRNANATQKADLTARTFWDDGSVVLY